MKFSTDSSIAIALVVIAVSNYSFATEIMGQFYGTTQNGGLGNFQISFSIGTKKKIIQRFDSVNKQNSEDVEKEKLLVLDYHTLLYEHSKTKNYFASVKDKTTFCNEASEHLSEKLNQLNKDELNVICRQFVDYLTVNCGPSQSTVPKEEKSSESQPDYLRCLYYDLSLDMILPSEILPNNLELDERKKTIYFNNFIMAFANQFAAIAYHMIDRPALYNFPSVDYYCKSTGNSKLLNVTGETSSVKADDAHYEDEK